MKTKIFLAVISFFLISIYNPIYSCTTFCIHTDDELVFGKNYDWMISNGIVFINKKDVVKTAFVKQGTPAKWISKYGSVTFNQFGREFPMGGMNEAGLVVELMWLDDTKYSEADERPAVGGVLQWIQYQLDNYGTVTDVISSDSKIRLPAQATPIHYLIADKNGDCASIDFLNGRLVYHAGETMMFKTLTNDTYEKSIEYLKRNKDFGGTQELNDDRSSLNRFVKACSMIKVYKKEPGRTAVDYGFEILNSVSQGNATKWSIVYDIRNMTTYFKTSDNSKIKNINLSLADFNCSSPVEMIDINSNIGGNINPSMIEYTYKANRKLIEDSYNGVEFLRSISEKERDITAEYPDNLNCRSKSSIDQNNIDSKENQFHTTVMIFTGIIFSTVILVLGYKKIKQNFF